MQSIFNKIIIMYQIVCQSGSQRCLYINELDVNKLRENIRSDFQDIFDNFDLMYIDEQHGDWMIIQNQSDYDKIIKLGNYKILIKVLPTLEAGFQPLSTQKKVGKIVFTNQLKAMIQFISNKYIQKYLQKKMTYKMMNLSQIMLQQKVPQSLTRFSTITSKVQANLGTNKKRRSICRVSPQKNGLNSKVEIAIEHNLNKQLKNIVGSCYKKYLQLVLFKKFVDEQPISGLGNMHMRKIRSEFGIDNPQQGCI